MDRNLWAKFVRLLPSSPLLVGTVQSHNSDGTSTIVLPDGNSTLRARGQGVAVNSKAFVKDGVVQGEAPNLPVTQIDI